MSEFEKFNTSSVRFVEGPGELMFLDIVNKLGSARIARQGAHVMSFAPAGERDVLWMSRLSYFAPGKPIRGGVPVCWPYFGGAPDGKGPSHGYARIADWDVASFEDLPDGRTKVVFALNDAMTGDAQPKFKFELTLTVIVGRELEMMLETVNRAQHPQEIGGALHTYFAVGNVTRVAVRGLDGAHVLDTVTHDEYVQHGEVTVDREIDRIFFDHTAPAEIVDPVYNRVIRLERTGSGSAVVWNPWIDKSKRMPDYGDDEFPGMICLETANARRDARTLAPGEKHILGSRISVHAL